MNILLISKLIIIISHTSTFLHPVHVSVTNIEFKKSEGQIEYSIRIFADDFEYALVHLHEKEINLTDGISDEEKKLVVDYLNTGFGIIIDEVKHPSICDDIKFHDNSTWIFCRIALPGNEFEKIKIINRILLDFFPDQTNLTVFSIDENQLGFTFDYKNTETEININNLSDGRLQNQ